MSKIDSIVRSLRHAGYSPTVQGNIIGVVIPHGEDKKVRNAIPMWKWWFYWVKTQTIHEHATGEKGNDIIEIR